AARRRSRRDNPAAGRWLCATGFALQSRRNRTPGWPDQVVDGRIVAAGWRAELRRGPWLAYPVLVRPKIVAARLLPDRVCRRSRQRRNAVRWAAIHQGATPAAWTERSSHRAARAAHRRVQSGKRRAPVSRAISHRVSDCAGSELGATARRTSDRRWNDGGACARDCGGRRRLRSRWRRLDGSGDNAGTTAARGRWNAHRPSWTGIIALVDAAGAGGQRAHRSRL